MFAVTSLIENYYLKASPTFALTKRMFLEIGFEDPGYIVGFYNYALMKTGLKLRKSSP